jgi:hypothetical protein|tara:strand:+ start:415 stop:579 length:165 start_codon:yes stop_codon:yes gene_type:complete
MSLFPLSEYYYNDEFTLDEDVICDECKKTIVDHIPQVVYSPVEKKDLTICDPCL